MMVRMELLKEFLNPNAMQYPRASDPMQNYFILRIDLIYLESPFDAFKYERPNL